jgi:hypothetical protein
MEGWTHSYGIPNFHPFTLPCFSHDFLSRHRNLLNQFIDHVVRAQSVRIGFVTQDDAMSQAIMEDGAYIVGGDVVAPIYPGVRAGNLVKG